MKRFFALLFVLILVVSCAVADDIDLSSLSFDELRQLQTDISKELIKRPEWKSVPVPPGIYQIGVDIPAGEWSLTCGKTEYGYVSVRCGSKTNETKTGIAMPWTMGEMIYQKGAGKGVNIENMNAFLPDGYYITIEYGELVFSTPERVNLGF